MRLLLAMFGVAVLIGSAAPAHGDPTPPPDGDDGGFLAALQQVGIGYSSPAQAISSGRAVCTCLNNGESGLELVRDVKLHNPGMDMETASSFALISAKVYCPHQLGNA